ncbi:MAG: CpaD family pilus assembly lipoprotein [Magnetospirillum sp.]|nr:CpaD family pilus assembly lipoprotein [Magnetospirillum sp.]
MSRRRVPTLFRRHPKRKQGVVEARCVDDRSACSRRARMAAGALAVAALLVGVAACSSADLAEQDYRQHYPVGVANHTAVAVVTQPEAGRPFSAQDAMALEQIGKDHLRRGSGPVTVTVAPSSGGADAKAAAQAFGERVAAAIRVPPADVKVVVAAGTAQRPDTALVEAPVWVAEIPECGNFDTQPTPDWQNGSSPNFGCATQRNIGLMVQDPADLVRMRESSGREGSRSADVLDKYGRGVATGSAKEAGGSSNISNVGSGSGQ